MNELAASVGMTQPTTSKHLRVLREAGLVQVRIQAQSRRYGIDPRGWRGAEEWLTEQRRVWSASLDRLDLHLRNDEGAADADPSRR